MAFSAKSKEVFKFIQANQDANITLDDIATAVGSTAKSVNGTVVALQKKDLVYREPAEIELEDGTHKSVKFIKTTEVGTGYDIDAEETPAE